MKLFVVGEETEKQAAYCVVLCLCERGAPTWVLPRIHKRMMNVESRAQSTKGQEGRNR